MMNFLDPYIGAIKGIALVGLLLGLFWFGHRTGAQSVQVKWDKAELARSNAEKLALAARTTENQTLLKQQEIHSSQLTKAHDDELAKTRATRAAAPRLSVTANCGGSAARTETKSAVSSNGGNTGSRLVSAGTQQDFDALEDRIETVFAGCRVAQRFIADNGFAK